MAVPPGTPGPGATTLVMSQPPQRRWLPIVVILFLAAGAVVVFWPLGSRQVSPGGSGAGAGQPAVTDHRTELARAQGIPDGRQRSQEVRRVLDRWWQQDEAGLVAHLRDTREGPARTEAILLLLEAVGRNEAPRALELARDLVRTREERAFYSSLFAGLADQDPALAVKHLALVPAGESRGNAVRAIAMSWGRREPDAALNWAGKLTNADERSIAREAAITVLAERDPLRAVRAAQELLTGPAQQRTLRSVLAKLAVKDPRAAGEIVRMLPAGDLQTSAAVDVARAYGVRQPADAITWSKTLPGVGLQRLALQTAVEAWAGEDPAAAGKYVAQMEPGPAQMLAADHVARIAAATDPQKAIAWAQTLPAGSARDFAMMSIASTWARREPAEAVQWASGLPAGETRMQALGSALSYWVLQDAAAAQKFVTGLKGELQIAAATALAPLLVQTNPKGAVEWARALPAPEPRDGALAATLRRWREVSPAAADAWLKTSNLPAATKAKLQKR